MFAAFTGNAEQDFVFLFDNSVGFDLAEPFIELVGKLNDKNTSAAFLIVSPDPSLARRGGFSIPNEFVLSVFELDRMSDRIRQLRAIYPNGVSTDLLRAFCVGAFRRYFYLDDDNHGLGEMDLSEIGAEKLEKWRGESGWPVKLLGRLGATGDNVPNPSDDLGRAFQKLFPEHMKEVAARMEALKASIDRSTPAPTAS